MHVERSLCNQSDLREVKPQMASDRTQDKTQVRQEFASVTEMYSIYLFFYLHLYHFLAGKESIYPAV
jgi:hypothetical protein